MNSLKCQDEILQMMYWMRGEHIGDSVRPDQLNRFLRIEEADLDQALQQLQRRGLVAVASGCCSLTDQGLVEAGRRFMDEFATVLGKENHLSCADPDCDCQSTSFDGACRSAEARHS